MSNLIGIAGAIGSGKDTAALIIKNLMYESFKDSYPVQISSHPDVFNDLGEWQIVKFAGALKKMATLFTGIPFEKFEDQEFKKSHLGPEWDNMQVRVFLQKLGTEAVRDNLHRRAWLNAMFSNFKPRETSYEQGVTFLRHPNFICSDMRFRNEFDEIKSRGGLTIYLERGEESTSTHPSEVEMREFKPLCDLIVDNNGTFFALEQNLKIFLQQNQLITLSV